MLATDLTLRDDLMEACALEWARLGAPGIWWNGSQRVSIAAAARAAVSCRLCAQRRRALSPAISGEHDGPAALPDATIDAIHRIRTDAARLTEPWLDDLLTTMSAAEYVELVGVVVTETFVDSLALALGSPLPELPDAVPGAATGGPPPEAVVHSAWVPTVLPEKATGAVADMYGQSAYSSVSNVVRALSLVPPELGGQKIRGGSTYRSSHLVLGKDQVELLATTTSAVNDCFY